MEWLPVKRAIAGLAALALAAAGCGGGGSRVGPGDGGLETRLGDVPFAVLAAGTAPMQQDPGTIGYLAGDVEQAAFLTSVIPGIDAELAGFDYERQFVLALLGGCQTDAAYTLELDSLSVEGERVVASGEVTRDPQAAGAQVISLPYLILAVGRESVPQPFALTADIEGTDGCLEAGVKP